MAVDDGYTVSLLHMDGTDASTTFTDESGKTWTASGNAQIDTAQSKFGGASGLFDGTGDYISTPDHADWQLDGGSNSNAWTIDFWVQFNGDPGTAIVGFVEQLQDTNNRWEIVLSSNALYMRLVSGGSTLINLGNAWNPTTATWYHVAVVKNGTTGYMMFVDGTQIGTTQTNTNPIPDFSGAMNVGTYNGGSYLNGWIDELRVSKGIARWTANFTPPTAPYTPFVPQVIWI